MFNYNWLNNDILKYKPFSPGAPGTPGNPVKMFFVFL